MSKTIVGLFNSISEAEAAKRTLITGGYEAKRVSIIADDESTSMVGSAAATTTTRVKDSVTAVGEKISNFFQSLTGGNPQVHTQYVDSVSQGGALLSVVAEDADASEVALLLKQYGARDIEDDDVAATTSTVATLDEQTAIPIVEEQMVVGKREVDRGGVRVYSHVVEQPVEADVTLRNERVSVQRRTVDRPATAADFVASDASIEVRGTGEEAVVGKSSRVVEEVMVGKQATEHVEVIHDSVRKTEVEVEQIPVSGLSTDRY